MKAHNKSSRPSRLKYFRPAAMLVIGAALVFITSATRAGSIFDDDYKPPTRTDPAPEQPVPTPPPENPAVPAPEKPGPATPPADVPAPTHAADNTIHRALPDRDSRVKCRKLFEEAFATELKDHSPAARRKLAQRLLDEAAKTTEGSADRFVLLTGAIQAAEEGQNLRMAFSAAKLLAKEFGVDELATKADVAAKTFAGSPSPALSSIANVELLLTLADQLVAEDAFTTVASVKSALQRAAGSVPDADLKKEVAEQIREESAIREAHDKLAPALAKLKQSPADPAANLAVGSYLCFQRGKWDKGLPMLAKSNDAQLKSLANAELAATSGRDAMIKAADGWFNAGPKLTAMQGPRAILHAGARYRAADVGATGLQRLAIEKRISKIPAPSRFRRIDLLELFDPATSVVSGAWRIEDGLLICEPGDNQRVYFAYQPPDEYDFRICFTTTQNADMVAHICDGAGHQFLYLLGGWQNTVAGFDAVGGLFGDGNTATKRKDHWLASGKHYTSVVKVRTTGVEAYLDGQFVTGLKTDYSDMSLRDDWRLPRTNVLGLVTKQNVVRFDSVEIIEITGEGKLLSGK